MRPTASNDLFSLLAHNPLVRVSLLSHHAGPAPYIGSRTIRAYALWSELREETFQVPLPRNLTTQSIESALCENLSRAGISAASAGVSVIRFEQSPPVYDAIIRLHGIHPGEAEASSLLLFAARSLFDARIFLRDRLDCRANDSVFKLGGQQCLASLSSEATAAIIARGERALFSLSAMAEAERERARL